MDHSFNVDVAVKHGIEKAVLLQNISFWVIKNKANKKNMHNGMSWTYNSQAAFSELFPYMSQQKIGRHLREMESAGLILSGNFNKAGYDRTKWYTVPSLFIVQNQTMDNSNLNDGLFDIEQPIPDINTNIKPDVSVRRFTPPTQEEILQCMSEKGYPYKQEAEKFFDFYECKGWMVGRNKMKNWKSAVNNWLKGCKLPKQQPKPVQQNTYDALSELQNL